MAYEVEFRYADSILFLDDGPSPLPQFLYADSYLEWQLSEGILFDAVSLDGLITI
jgi:hypothetical protein